MLLDAGETKQTDPNTSAHSQGAPVQGGGRVCKKIVPLEDAAWGGQKRWHLGICEISIDRRGERIPGRENILDCPQVVQFAQRRNRLETHKNKKSLAASQMPMARKRGLWKHHRRDIST